MEVEFILEVGFIMWYIILWEWDVLCGIIMGVKVLGFAVVVVVYFVSGISYRSEFYYVVPSSVGCDISMGVAYLA